MKKVHKLIILFGSSVITLHVHAINPLVMNWVNSQVTSRFKPQFRSQSKKLFSHASSITSRFTTYSSTYLKPLSGKHFKSYSAIIIPELGCVGYNPFSLNKYRFRSLYQKLIQRAQKNKTRTTTNYQALSPAQIAYKKAQQLMQECMLNLNEKRSFSSYIEEVVHIAHQYPNEMCTQLDIENVDGLITNLEEVKDTSSCTEVITVLRPYWNLLPETVRTTPKATLLYNLWWRLSY